MQVILLERVAKLGQMGEVVDVKSGYARNYLLPQGKALSASKANVEAFEGQKAQLEAQNLETKKEAEQFAEKGGWKVDTQFIESMGSPYLNAHGLGDAVSDATTTAEIPEDGEYRVWVRTIDWSERLGRAEGAGRFSLQINGKPVGGELGKGKPEWDWQNAGIAKLKAGKATFALKDLSGFNARVDAILLSNDQKITPPTKLSIEDRTQWDVPGSLTGVEELKDFDLVVVGGGYGGMGSALSAARLGAKVALIQNRKVLGGNGSSEIRVWAKGNFPPNEYPFASIIKEVTDGAKASPGTYEEFEDAKKERILRAEKNITLLLGHHGYGVKMDGDRIAQVITHEGRLSRR